VKSGVAVLNMVVGAFVALLFLGLPLAIIGLFIASTLDRRNIRPPEGIAEAAEASSVGTGHAGDRRRRIVYGRSSLATAAPAERHEPARARGGKV
jgi:hypothetical protein